MQKNCVVKFGTKKDRYMTSLSIFFSLLYYQNSHMVMRQYKCFYVLNALISRVLTDGLNMSC